MQILLDSVPLDLAVLALRHDAWIEIPLGGAGPGFTGSRCGIEATLTLSPPRDRQIDFTLSVRSPFRTRLRLRVRRPGVVNPFHLIPANIHGDNNAAHVRPGEFPLLSTIRPGDRACSPLWELRADRSSHPVSILCGDDAAVGIRIDPYADDADQDAGFLRNGVFAQLPDAFGVSLGYGNDPLTFFNKTLLLAATSHTTRAASAGGSIYVAPGGRSGAHAIVRRVYAHHHERATHQRTESDALHALGKAFIEVNWSDEVQQYTNRKCRVPTDTTLRPWRAIVEIGWTGGSMLAYPFLLAERRFPDLHFPKTGAHLLDEICGGFNPRSGLIDDTTINRSTRNRPAGWNDSSVNGWWSGFISPTRDHHCAYTNAHAAYYLLESALLDPTTARTSRWTRTALRVLDTAVALQRDDGAFGYIFSRDERRVTDFDGFAGCWFAAALPLAFLVSDDRRYLDAAERALAFYSPFVRDLAAWGSPMDTCRSIDSEGNLAFIRAARLMHETTGDDRHLDLLASGAHYEYLWRYGFRSRPQAPPLQGSRWNSCGGSITSVSNPHIHPMSVVVTHDLEYLARESGDGYHQSRADDGIAWLLNTMELYPDIVGYGRYGVLSERTCPSDGLLEETYDDTGAVASTWWSYNAWAAGSAMEALAQRLRGRDRGRP
jgi:hypothetical protein